MLNLIQNEHMKWFMKKSTKVVFLAIAVLTLGMALIMRAITTNAGITETLPGFVAFTSNFLIIVQFFAVAAAGSIVASEFEKGTIKLLLIRPKSRSTILLSKYLTSIFISLYYLAAFFLFSIIWGIIFFSGGAFNGQEGQGIWIAYGVSYLETFMMVAFAFMLSSVFRNSALAVGLGIVVGVGAKMLAGILSEFQVQWGIILLFANTNLSQYMDGNQTYFPGMTLPFSLLIIIAHLLFFVGTAWLFFLKRDVAN
ncbi:ABC transporter permease [Priestia flexa]|uniref:ABC transporter permease n=1 Tax=Priestia veravalensis TaxID=1414648 RepID=A0A0V8JPU2_9BACI|nr:MULTISPECIES: ABC transporter permease [Priestia]KSU89034.1 ABC transporter permease [Priestia veravalensis]MCM3068032.1 ABC transporter permease [Priestia flexa]MEC0668060.1 ABC transporter permease [Priestia flexa]MED3825360.1 ABC transporter permease [Priestia flexa]SCB94422.1 ABC-2 type transport system permease protein [Priestia flexa]